MKQLKIALKAVALVVLVAGVTTPSAWAIKLDEAEIFIEINDTDGDAGIQVFLDGEDWDSMQAFAPDGSVLFTLMAEESIAEQGITELFFESAEPSFDEQPLEDFLELFPAGTYRFRGTTTEDDVIRGRAKLTHSLPDAPVLISPADGAVVNRNSVVVEWQRVPNPPGGRIVGYQVIVEKDEGALRTFSADVNAGTTRMTVPPEFLLSGTAYKYEVLAREKSGNQTISEAEFETQ